MKRPQQGKAAGWLSKWGVASFEHEGAGIKAGQHHAIILPKPEHRLPSPLQSGGSGWGTGHAETSEMTEIRSDAQGGWHGLLCTSTEGVGSAPA